RKTIFRDALEECYAKLTDQGLLIQDILSECMGLPPGFLAEYNADRASLLPGDILRREQRHQRARGRQLHHLRPAGRRRGPGGARGGRPLGPRRARGG
uniref:Uncharacterized protein n=1 Tax=Aegilops tauschii subsp. strangulata TaxID=200361 RepID=A0A452XBP1_AEGTS